MALNKEDYQIEPSIGISECILGYFTEARYALKQYEKYLTRHRELDFSKMRRFLVTTFKTLNEIDSEFMAQKLGKLYANVEEVSRIYDDFVSKSRASAHAYEVVFLRRQEEYTKLEALSAYNVNEMAVLRIQTEEFKEKVAEQKEKLKKMSKGLSSFVKAEEDFKRLKRVENSAIVRLGEIIGENVILAEVLKNFRDTYEEQFLLMYAKYTQNVQPELLTILNALAFEFDVEMWLKANNSEVIRGHFKNAFSKDVINSRTYLNYYLKGLDQTKLSDEHRQLQALLNYLNVSSNIHCVLFLPIPEDLHRFETALKADKSGFILHGYADAKVALSHAFRTRIDILILDMQAQNNILENFLALYQKNAKNLKKKAKIILIANEVDDASIAQANMLGADSIIERDVEAVEIINTVYEMLKVENSAVKK